MYKLLSITSLLFILVACASNPGVVQVSPDTYLISRIDKGGIFGNAAKMKADVIQEANDCANKKERIAIPISIDETPMAPGRNVARLTKWR